MPDSEDGDDGHSRWTWLGLGGALSLCCVFAAPAGTAAVGGTTAGATTAAVGGGVGRIAVAAVTVAVIAFLLRLRFGSTSNS